MIQIPSQPPGIDARTSLSRFRARKYRLAAASGLIPRTSAVSPRPSSSKCFKARTSRSIGSSVLRASWMRSSRLEDVRGIEARPQPGVHAELDHAPQPLAKPLEQLTE